MSGKKHIALLVFLLVFLLLFNLPGLSQDHPYLLDKELLDIIQSEVSGERAWDMMSKISRFHRIRGGGDGSDYNRCVEFLAKELKALGLVSCEYDETEVEFGLHYARDLEKIGLISFE